jgi:gliding motility-associated-like protein
LSKILILLTFVLIQYKSFAHGKEMFPPVEYIENQGQWNAPFKYKGSTARGDIYLRENGFTIMLADQKNAGKADDIHHGNNSEPAILNFFAYQVNFLNSNKQVKFTHEKPQSHYYNYYLGSDKSTWKSGIHPVLAVNYEEIYEGINMHVYSEDANVKYDMIANPHSDLSQIKIEYKGQEKLSIEKNKLLIKTSFGDVVEMAPYSYQYIDGEKVEIPCEYQLNENIVTFKVGKKYNDNYTLYIDPTLIFCTFVGSTGDSWGYTATYDTSGNFYAGGIILAVAYPTTVGAIQTTFMGGVGGSGMVACDACFTKFNPAGTAVIYATYLGGSHNDQPHSMIVDNVGNLVIAGRTFSTNFPITGGVFDNSYNGAGDMFVCKFNPIGTNLIASTFVGGSGEDGVNISTGAIGGLKRNYADDSRSEVIVDANNNIYIASCTKSTNFPTANPSQSSNAGLQDAVFLELNPSLTNLVWSTYWGGASNDAGYVLSINKINPLELFIAGGTESGGATTPGTLHTTYQGGSADGFLLKFNTTSKALIAGTFIGTNAYDQVYGVQTDDSNNVYITGQTLGAYPVTANVFSVPNSSQFVTKLNNNLSSIIASTVFGTGTTASTDIAINAFLVDKCQNVYVSGWGGILNGANVAGSTTFGLPTTPGAIQTTTDGQDFYVIVFNKNFATQQYGTFFGGPAGEHVDGGTSRFDENGVIYQAICGGCGGLQEPTTPGVIYPTNLSAVPTPNCNLTAVKIKFDFQNPDAQAAASGPISGCVPFVVNFVNSSTSATNFVWDFGDGSPTSTAINPSHTYTTGGVFTVTLTANNPNGCTASTDQFTMIVTVKTDSISANFNMVKVDSCNPYTANFINTSIFNGTNPATFTWDFGDGSPTFTGTTPPLHPYLTAGPFTVTLTMVDPTACNTPSVKTKVIDYNASLVSALFQMPDSVCMPAIVNFTDQSNNAVTYNWTFGDGQTSTQIYPTNTYASPGIYTVRLITINTATCNKRDTLEKTITVFVSPIADFSITPNIPSPNTPFVFTNLSVGASSYLWDFGDGQTSTQKDEVHAYDADGSYLVCLTASNQIGCKDTTCKLVRSKVIPLAEVPTGFSPNGDGKNDILFVRGYGIRTMVFRIYNRWGQKIFESNDKSIGWDGTFKGAKQEMEVYAYTLDVDFKDGTKDFKKGNVTLLK